MFLPLSHRLWEKVAIFLAVTGLMVACHFTEFDTSVICIVLILCLGLFRLQDMFKIFLILGLEGQSLKCFVKYMDIIFYIFAISFLVA